MLCILVAALAVAPPSAEKDSDVAALLAELHDWHTGKTFLGMTEKEVLKELGKPTSTKPGVWEYQEREAHDDLFAWVRVIRFKGGKVVSAAREGRAVGCLYRKRRE
jgi:hypothetical protein